MKTGPFDITVTSNKGGVCELRVIVQPNGVQTVFDKVMIEATAVAQRDPAVRAIAGIQEGDPIPPEQVFDIYADSIHHSVRTSLVEWALVVAIDKLDLRVIEAPIALVPQLKRGEPIPLTIKCFVLPTLPANVLDGFAAARAPISVDDEQVARAVAQLPRLGPAPPPDPERVAAIGDVITAEIEATADGVALDDARFAGAQFDLDPEAAPAALIDPFVGARAGEAIAIALDLADGRSVDVAVRITAVHPGHSAVVDAALAQRYGVADVAALTALVRESLLDVARRRDEAGILRAAATHVLARKKIRAPEILVRRRFVKQAYLEINQRIALGAAVIPPGADDLDAAFAATQEALTEQASQGLVIAALAAQVGVAVSGADLAAWMAARAERRGLDPKQMTNILADSVYYSRLRDRLVQERLVDRLVDRRVDPD